MNFKLVNRLVTAIMVSTVILGLLTVFMVLREGYSPGVVDAAGPNPTPTAPMPGDPPPSQDWLDNRATLDAPKPAPYPAPSTPTPPAAYPEQEQEVREVSGGLLAGLWAWIWDLGSN